MSVDWGTKAVKKILGLTRKNGPNDDRKLRLLSSIRSLVHTVIRQFIGVSTAVLATFLLIALIGGKHFVFRK